MKFFYTSSSSYRCGLLSLFFIVVIGCLRAQPPVLLVNRGLPCGRAAPAAQVVYGNGHYLAFFQSPARLYLSAEGDSSWQQALSAPQLTHPVLAYGRGVFVGVGDSGKIFISIEGELWSSRPSGTTVNLRDVQFFNGAFYATGDSATLLRSSNGLNWTRLSTGAGAATDSYRGIVFGDSVLVINSLTSGGTGVAIRSDSSLSAWTAIPLGVPGGVMRFLKDRFYFLAPQSTLTSTDAFTTIDVINQNGVGFAPLATDGLYDGSRIFLFYQNNLYPSEDGLMFSFSYNLPGPAMGVDYVNGHFFANGIFGIQRSENGFEWSLLGGNFTSSATNGVNFTAVGYWQGPSFFFGQQGLVASSTDGLHWKTRVIADQSMDVVIYDSTEYLAVGGAAYASSDGLNWTVPPGVPIYVSWLTSGAGIRLASDGAAFFRSANGGFWDFIAGPPNPTGYPLNIRRLKYVNGNFYVLASIYNTDVRISSLALFVSPDGINWTDITPQLPFHAGAVSDMAYDGHKYYLIGPEQDGSGQRLGFYTVSTANINNPTSYGPKGGPVSPGLLLGTDSISFSYNDSHFVGGVTDVNGHGHLIYSSDGLQWNTIPLGSLTTMASVVVKDGAFAALGTNNVSAVLRFPVWATVGHGSDSALRAYPNPAFDQVTIQLPPEETAGKASRNIVWLYNTSGVLLQKEEFGGYQVTLSLKGIPAGILHVVVSANGRNYRKEVLHW